MKHLLILSLLLATCNLSLAAKGRPNFVFFLSEDNSIHYLEHFFPGGAKTPNIEALAENGLTFDRAFSNSPVCSVARTTLITSCYAPRIGTQYHRRAAMAPMPDGVKMFPEVLRDAGYHTTNNSKTDYNATPTKNVWDASSKKAHWKNRKPGQPFFHQRTRGTSHESSLHFSEQKMRSTNTKTDPASVQLAPIFPDTPTFRYTHATYHDRIVDIDRQVGELVAELEAEKLLEDTFIFYFGDHGGVLPRGKGYAYETGLHVPLVVRVPENFKHLVTHKKNTRTNGFVSFVDFGPTLLHLAGLDVPNGVDGTPFLGPDISPTQLAKRDEAFGYADRFDEKYDLVRTLRKGRYTYIRSYQPFNIDALQNDYRYKMIAYREWRDLFHAGKLNPVQSAFFQPRAPEALYDIDADPFETRNLAADPAYAATLTSMRQRLQEIVTSMPDLSFVPEPVMVADAMLNPVAYGQKHKQTIAALVALNDLQLAPFQQAVDTATRALFHASPWHRYTALIAATAHGKTTPELTSTVKKLAASDPDPLVRTRAAEFLAINADIDPTPAIKSALSAARSATEANLILNTAALLHDAHGVRFDLTASDTKFSDRYINARLTYLATP